MSVPLAGTKSVLREDPTIDEIADYNPNRQARLI
jgi:hypothetical protein